MSQYVQNVLCTILSNLGFPRFWPKIVKSYFWISPYVQTVLCRPLSNLRFLRFWQGSTKNSLGSTRNLYQNLFQTILSNFGFEPRSKDVLSFGQILSNRKKFSRIEAKSVSTFPWKSSYQILISKLQRFYMYILWKCLY